MNAATLINQTSGQVEYYTPQHIVEAARLALGGVIDLDPASSAAANERVKASRFYTREQGGLIQSWECETLWMNHPFGRVQNPLWIENLIDAFELGLIKRAACCITFACTSEEWFRPLLDFPQCFLWPRTNYLLPDGTVFRGVTKGSVVTFLGRERLDTDLFRESFEGLGTVKI